MNIQEQLNSLIRGNPLSVDTYLREVCKNETIFYKGIMPSEVGFRFSSGL